MEEQVDYYFNEAGLMVFTETYHRKRGYCCKNKCRHCPWGFGSKKGQTVQQQKPKNSTTKHGDTTGSTELEV